MDPGRVLIVGFDALDGRYLDRFAGSLDAFSRLRDDGADAALESIHPPWTGAAWPSMYTGLDPSHTGAFDFFDYRDAYPDEADVITRDGVCAPAIWNYATAAGLDSIVVNVPATHPAEPIDGVVLPGYLAAADAPGYPPGIRDELESALGATYDIYSPHETNGTSGPRIDAYEALVEQRGEATAQLLRTHPWDLAFVQVQKTDAVFHHSSSLEDFERIYRAADRLLGRLLDTVPATTNVIVCSDHGIGPVTGYTVYVNELLREHGFVETATSSSEPDLRDVKTGETARSQPPAALERVGVVAQRLGFSPADAFELTERLGVGDAIRRHLPESVKRSLTVGVDWRASRAYCRSGSEQGVRINLAGRDPAGVVAPDEYEDVRERIIDLLRDLTTPDGDPVFEYVCKREERYTGPYADAGCDILFRTTDMNHFVSTTLPGGIMTPADTYNHKATGVFLAQGPDVDADWAAGPLSLLDVAPIVFGLLDEPVPARMHGQAPAALLETDLRQRDYGDVPYGTDGTHTQDQGEVTDRLRDLGYL